MTEKYTYVCMCLCIYTTVIAYILIRNPTILFVVESLAPNT